ncbi:M61 glycyl aminopeptidase [Tsuneonella dongtanensis]|uniref:M61 glycyl aminopeptidase n=2 Tax=Tsuneonella dongtanensis TaxID=692370 RepID=A0A1B2A9A1_9SPHN|nr:M61 glycyl aminopeptidase [Tsuneonella dongtanensis]
MGCCPMRRAMFARLITAAAVLAFAAPAVAERSMPPVSANARVPALPPSRDVPWPGGTMTLAVDASDTIGRAFRTQQTIPLPAGTRELVLVYPKWLPGNHGPTGQIHRLGDIKFTSGSRTLSWERDEGEPYAFRIAVPAGAREVNAFLTYTSPFSSSDWRPLMTQALANVQWEKMSLYPAGHAVRRIKVRPRLTLPEGWTAAAALDGARQVGRTVEWAETDYETLVDSPVFAGAHRTNFDLGQNVTLNVFADHPRQLAAPDELLPTHRKMVAEITHLFGTRQFDRYEFLVALTDELGGIGLEHHRSSENTFSGNAFTDWKNQAHRRGLLPHEMVHSWNGKHRRPAALWAPDYHTQVNGDLLWVYEGQTSFWDSVLAARSGVQPKDVALGEIATNAANYSAQAGRAWRSVEDTTFNPALAYRKPQPFPTLSRGTDYYSESALIWLEADQIIRRGTGEARGLDDFAKVFFGTSEGDWGVKTYTFDDVVAALNAVHPYDWAGFLDTRFRKPGQPAPTRGIEMAGYRLVWKDEPNPFTKQGGAAGDFAWSLGFSVGSDGTVSGTRWGSPGHDAGLVPGTVIEAVDGFAFSRDRLTTAVKEARDGKAPIRLIVKRGDRFDTVDLKWTGGLRFPWIEPAGEGEQPLDRLLAPRTQ